MSGQDHNRRILEMVGLLQLIANPQRLRVLCELRTGERNVSQLESVLDLSQSALSQHLARLRDGGIVQARKIGREQIYDISDTRVRMLLDTMAKLPGPCQPQSRAKARKSAKI